MRATKGRFNLLFVSLLLAALLLPLTEASSARAQTFSELASISQNFNADYQDISAANPQSNTKQFRYIDITGHSIIGPILRFYNRTGGEARHGKPLSEPIYVKGHYQQYFERSVLEFYPDYAGTPEEVRFYPLGKDAARLDQIKPEPVTPFEGQPDNWYFPETGHSLKGPFLTFWRNSGDTTALGLPISEEQNVSGPDGSALTVQYFEFARLQSPAKSADPAEVSISDTGSQLAHQNLTEAQLASIPRARFEAPRVVKIPSLMFHYVRIVDQKKDPLGWGLSITPDNYVKFLDWVKDNGYTTVTISQILDYLKYGILLPEKAVNFRWDDGHDDNWFVYQEMKKRGMTATFYVITQRLELTPTQWQQIDADGFEVSAHTRTHPDLRGVKDPTNEIVGSKSDIEAILGHPVRTFAYPYGEMTDNAKRIVRTSGFELAVSTKGGYNWNLDSMYEQPTLGVTGRDNITSFAFKITDAYNTKPPSLVSGGSSTGSGNSSSATSDSKKKVNASNP
ncbi:MAG TPA: polysaccharide deacetylase family protein [Chloroflexia bacterium]|nr:polysaccharide deacetylase family protein [Chloroflexia bacterium]